MRVITRGKEQSLVIGETIRVEILESRQGEVRLGVDVPEGVDIWAEESWERGTGRRRDLVCWHPAPCQLALRIVEHFQCDPHDVRPIGCGLAYFGHDPCLFGRMSEFVQGYCWGESTRHASHRQAGSAVAGIGTGHRDDDAAAEAS